MQVDLRYPDPAQAATMPREGAPGSKTICSQRGPQAAAAGASFSAPAPPSEAAPRDGWPPRREGALSVLSILLGTALPAAAVWRPARTRTNRRKSRRLLRDIRAAPLAHPFPLPLGPAPAVQEQPPGIRRGRTLFSTLPFFLKRPRLFRALGGGLFDSSPSQPSA